MFFRPTENPDKAMTMRRARSIGKSISRSLEENPDMIEPTNQLTGRILEVEAEWRNLGGGF